MKAKFLVPLSMLALFFVATISFYSCEKEADSAEETEAVSTAKGDQNYSDKEEAFDEEIEGAASGEKRCVYTIDEVIESSNEPGAAKYKKGGKICRKCPDSNKCPKKDETRARVNDSGGNFLVRIKYSGGGGACEDCPAGGIKTN